MRKEFIFNRSNEDISKYMTRATEILRSIRTGNRTATGICYKEELSLEEQNEFSEYVITIAVDEMEKTTAKTFLRRNQFDSDSEDFISNFKIVILKNIDKFNDPEHLAESGKKYCFSTFLKHLASEAIRMTYADIHGVTVDVEKKFTLIMGVMKQVAIQNQITVNSVTPEMVHEARPNISIRDIIAVLNYIKGNVSLEKLIEEDGLEKRIFKQSDDLDTNIFDVLDSDTKRILDNFLGHLSDVEKFFVLLEVHCCDKEYTKMTAAQLSTNPLLLRIVESDQKLKRNLSVGDITIERPGRSSSGDNISIELKGVIFINNNLIRYQRAKAVKTLSQLKEVLTMPDVIGICSKRYFIDQWKILIGNYEINKLGQYEYLDVSWNHEYTSIVNI